MHHHFRDLRQPSWVHVALVLTLLLLCVGWATPMKASLSPFPQLAVVRSRVQLSNRLVHHAVVALAGSCSGFVLVMPTLLPGISASAGNPSIVTLGGTATVGQYSDCLSRLTVEVNVSDVSGRMFNAVCSLKLSVMGGVGGEAVLVRSESRFALGPLWALLSAEQQSALTAPPRTPAPPTPPPTTMAPGTTGASSSDTASPPAATTAAPLATPAPTAASMLYVRQSAAADSVLLAVDSSWVNTTGTLQRSAAGGVQGTLEGALILLLRTGGLLLSPKSQRIQAAELADTTIETARAVNTVSQWYSVNWRAALPAPWQPHAPTVTGSLTPTPTRQPTRSATIQLHYITPTLTALLPVPNATVRFLETPIVAASRLLAEPNSLPVFDYMATSKPSNTNYYIKLAIVQPSSTRVRQFVAFDFDCDEMWRSPPEAVEGNTAMLTVTHAVTSGNATGAQVIPFVDLSPKECSRDVLTFVMPPVRTIEELRGGATLRMRPIALAPAVRLRAGSNADRNATFYLRWQGVDVIRVIDDLPAPQRDPPPLMPASGARDAAWGTAMVAGAVAVILGRPGISTFPPRAEATLVAVQCTKTGWDLAEVPVSWHPLRFRFGDGPLAQFGGAVVGNAALLAGWSLCHFTVVLLVACFGDMGFADARATLSFPSLLVVPLTLVAFAIAVAATTILRVRTPDDARLRLAAVGSIVVLFVALLFTAYHLTRGFAADFFVLPAPKAATSIAKDGDQPGVEATEPTTPEAAIVDPDNEDDDGEAAAGNDATLLLRVLRCWDLPSVRRTWPHVVSVVVGEGWWVDRSIDSALNASQAAAADDVPPGVELEPPIVVPRFVERYELFFAGTRADRHWFFLLDISMAVVAGVLAGMNPVSPAACSGLAVCLACLSLLYCALLLLLRPFAAPLDFVAGLTMALLQLCGDIAAATFQNDGPALAGTVAVWCALFTDFTVVLRAGAAVWAELFRRHERTTWQRAAMRRGSPRGAGVHAEKRGSAVLRLPHKDDEPRVVANPLNDRLERMLTGDHFNRRRFY
jgi:hypothetical protein